MKITLPKKLSRDVRNQVRESYLSRKRRIDCELERKIIAKIPRIINRLGIHRHGFKYQIGLTAKSLFDCYVQTCIRKNLGIRLSKNGRRSIVAALEYLCDPQDVIPDYTPGMGFIDDALVLNICIQDLGRSDPKALALAEELRGRLNNVVS